MQWGGQRVIGNTPRGNSENPWSKSRARKITIQPKEGEATVINVRSKSSSGKFKLPEIVGQLSKSMRTYKHQVEKEARRAEKKYRNCDRQRVELYGELVLCQSDINTLKEGNSALSDRNYALKEENGQLAAENKMLRDQISRLTETSAARYAGSTLSRPG